ncbi:hypothetical protein O181_003855 [Austropuccinia psidii MF-1]|uniref:Uncharacterized protein n=1 Tax=Austropuccinia psidii MF-1 TaxID=1389203 RepID=A0A9Q3GEB2_9BASI|nr:hypothetical protein [Austropuccinia psidii MF-1]
MSWFSHYSTDQALFQFLPCNKNLIQALSQGTLATGTGEESQIPPLPPYSPLRSPNRPHLSRHITIIGPQVPKNTTPGPQCRPQETSSHLKGQKTFLSGDWIQKVKSLHQIGQLMAPSPI